MRSSASWSAWAASHRRSALRQTTLPLRATWAAAVAVALAGAPCAVRAQVVRGVVLDDNTGEPVVGAAVRVFEGDEVRRALEVGASGRFVTSLPGGGEYSLEVSRLGYKTARSRPILVELGDTLSVELRVLPEAVLLRPLLVRARSSAGRNQFERRKREWGRGVFLGPEQIDSINPRYVGDVFRGMDKVRLRWGWGRYASGASGPLPRVNTYLGRGCLLYLVDRVPVRPEPWGSGLDWASYQLSGLLPKDVVAVEVYRGVFEVPPELRRYASRTLTLFGPNGITRRDQDLCGVAVIHTRAGW